MGGLLHVRIGVLFSPAPTKVSTLNRMLAALTSATTAQIYVAPRLVVEVPNVSSTRFDTQRDVLQMPFPECLKCTRSGQGDEKSSRKA